MKQKVMLAMSGGIDSSVALIMLKDKYEVIGVTLRLYDNDEEIRTGICRSLKDAEDAKAVANRYGIEHYVYDFRDIFKKQVIDRFTKSYLSGKTPNPCIECNSYVKFGALWEKAKALGCDYIATGHYARTCYDPISGRTLLKKAICDEGENEKDQSYVLYNLTQEQLSHTLFPLGEISKTKVREIASKNNLVNRDKPESQDICFVPEGKYGDFIRKETGAEFIPGEVVDTKGNVVGIHNGIINYTIGQRKGLGIAFGKPMYVVDKDASKNIVTVGENADLMRNSLIASDLNWISIPELKEPLCLSAKTRYRQKEQTCMVSPLPDNRALVEFDYPQRAITKGQRVVFYDGDIVAGGGVIY